MVQPIKLYKKVTLVYLSHILVATSVITFVAYPGLPCSIQSEFDRYVENLVNIGEFIQTKLDELADCLISILKWAHREPLATHMTLAQIVYSKERLRDIE